MGDSKVIGAFSDIQASRITGVSINQLREWDKDGFFKPTFGTRRAHIPYGRLYSFRDLVSLQVLHDLRNHKRIPLSHLKRVSEKLAHLGEERWTSLTLYVLGKRVVFDNPSTLKREEIVSGQRVFNIPLRVVIKSTRRRIDEINALERRAGEFEKRKFVAQNERVFAGTRIPVSVVIDFLKSGSPSERILKEFPSLNIKDIDAAVAEMDSSKAA